MKVSRLIIRSFGNQRNKVIDFSTGTNVIMSPDSMSVNTVRSFLDGMFFGLSDEDRKRFRPKRLPYSGVLMFETDEGDQIQVDRNFLNGDFTVTNVNGDEITEDYTDEFGDLVLFPVNDSIFAQEIIEVPEISSKDLEQIEELEKKKKELSSEYNYQNLIKERDEIVKKLTKQQELEEEVNKNNEKISENEQRLTSLEDQNKEERDQIDREIQEVKSQNESLNLKLDKLKDKQDKQGSGKAQVLKRDVQNTDHRIKVIDKRISDLQEEEKLYSEKLTNLKGNFKVDREELKNDFESYQNSLVEKRVRQQEPIVEKLIHYSFWVYAILIVVCISVISYAIYNPNDLLTRVPIYLICFVCSFIILSSVVILYLQFNRPIALPNQPVVMITGSEAEKIFKKYNQENNEDFTAFFNNAKRIFNRIDNLEADLKDIRQELQDSENEKQELLEQQSETKLDLTKNRVEYNNTAIQDEILSVTKQIKANEAKIDELEEEKDKIKPVSAWKLKEESFKLNEENRRLEKTPGVSNSEIERFKEIQSQINFIENESHRIDQEIEALKSQIYNNKEIFINSYAEPGDEDYNKRIAQQFGFGLQNNINANNPVPLISLNPLENIDENNSELIEKFKMFLEDNQALLFMTDFDELDILRDNGILFNGVFLK